MADTTPFYAGSTIPFEWDNGAVAITNIVIDFVKDSDTLIKRFAYPAMDNAETLIKDGNKYSGIISGIDTETISAGKLSLHVKEFVSDSFVPIGVIPITTIANSSVSSVKKW